MEVGDIVEDGSWAGFEVISVYGRAQAIADGVIVPVEDLVADEPGFAAQAGWRVPVGLTAAVAAIVMPTGRERDEGGQDVKGRLWDLLSMGRIYGRRGEPTWLFPCIFWLAGRDEYGRRAQRTLRFKVVLGGDDGGEPVATIMLPEED